MRKVFLMITAVVCLLFWSLPATAQDRIFQPKPVYVFLNFEGDPNFPSLTYHQNTTGLARFTGSAFRLTPQERDWVVQKIIELLPKIYVHTILIPEAGGPIRYNIEFLTDKTGLDPDSYYTWGIDDNSYLYQEGDMICPARLHGKAGGNPRTIGPRREMLVEDHVDINGNSLYHPKYARTFAGSHALIEGTCPKTIKTGDFSVPPLIPLQHCTQAEVNEWNCGKDNYGGPITVDNVAIALANNAAHEIAHLFGAVHVSLTSSIMSAELESAETLVNSFDYSNKQRLLNSIGEVPRLATSAYEPTVTDTGTGLMWTKDANLPASIRSDSGLGGGGVGLLDAQDATNYMAYLRYDGYKDWRLPSGMSFDGTGPCENTDYNPSISPCTDSEPGHLYYNMLGNSRGNFEHNFRPFINVGNLYWTTVSGGFGGFSFFEGLQWGEYDDLAFLSVWPVRDAYKLFDNGDGTITDTSTGLMWIKDVNLAGDPMAWLDANTWAGNLIYAGYNDWRLPKTREPDGTCDKPEIFSGVFPGLSMGCSQSEMGYLFNRWGITTANPGPFILGINPIAYNWSKTESFSYPDTGAWAFSFRYGEQAQPHKSLFSAYAWAVREIKPGDTSPGTDVRVEPSPKVSVTFSDVTNQGFTSVEVSQNNPESEEPGFQFLGTFYDITTTTSHSGSIQVCFTYENSEVPPGTDEKDLKIMHWVEYCDIWGCNAEWRDVTDYSYPDIVYNLICGTVGSLSWFGIAMTIEVQGDLDGDNDIDQNDLNILLSFRNQPASACPACDLDGDGMITVLDSRKLVLLCTRLRCATQ